VTFATDAKKTVCNAAITFKMTYSNSNMHSVSTFFRNFTISAVLLIEFTISIDVCSKDISNWLICFFWHHNVWQLFRLTLI